jgi:hypothetical protein
MFSSVSPQDGNLTSELSGAALLRPVEARQGRNVLERLVRFHRALRNPFVV